MHFMPHACPHIHILKKNTKSEKAYHQTKPIDHNLVWMWLLCERTTHVLKIPDFKKSWGLGPCSHKNCSVFLSMSFIFKLTPFYPSFK